MSRKSKKSKQIEHLQSATDFDRVFNREAVVGVLTTRKGTDKYPLPSGKDEKLKKEMIISAHESGIFMFFFYPDGVDWKNQKIAGHTYQHTRNRSGKWVKGVFPLPNIVYNRLSYRKHEAQEDVQKLLAAFSKNPYIHLFNSRFLDKWEVHRCLSQSSIAADLVPETRLFNKENLFIMLCKYQELFIKPVDKSIGKGIIMVRRRPQNKYLYYKLAASEEAWKRSSSSKNLYDMLKSIIDYEERYIIQKRLDLATIDGRVFDLRTEVQKNGNGQWVFTGVGVRIAAKGKFVTHVPNGGSRAIYEEVIRKVFGKSKSTQEKMDQQLHFISRNIPSLLENNLGLALGILSIDIGIDRNGIMQIIEVNSKPSSFDENEIRMQHLDNLNRYFIYLINSSNSLGRRD